jgi:hypothetical protein
MGKLSDNENAWLDKATAAAIAAARKIAQNTKDLPAQMPVAHLSDSQWGWMITAAIFAWIRVRVEQAIAEGLDQEQAVRLTGVKPAPCEVAVATSILPKLADQAKIDWSLPLAAWPKETMTDFLLLAWQLLKEAETARDRGPKIVRESIEQAWDKFGDPLPL